MNCDDARRSLADYIDDQLSEDIRRSIEEHLATCGECSAILAESCGLPRFLLAIPPLLVPESVYRQIADKANRALNKTVGGRKFAPRGLERFTRLTALGLTAIVIAVTLAAFTFALMFDARFEMLDIFNIRDLNAGQGQLADESAKNPTFEDLVLRAESTGPKAYDYLPRPEISVSGKHYAADALEQVAIEPIVVAFAQEYRDVEAKLYRDNIISEITAQATMLGLEKRVLRRSVETVLAETNDHALPSYIEKAFLNEEEVLLIVVNRTDVKSGRLLTGISVFAFDPATLSIVASWPRTPLSQAIELRDINPHKSLACIACHPNFEGSTKDLENAGWIQVAKRTCSRCHSHEKQHELYAKSVHGQLALSGRTGKRGVSAPACGNCHDAHATLASNKKPQTLAEMRTHAKNICGNCHKDYWESYNDYYHGKGYKAAAPDAPACWDCHGYHDVLPSRDPKSRVSAKNLPETCSRCHADADLTFVEYGKMVHGKKAAQGKSPVWQQFDRGLDALKDLVR